MPSPKRHHGYSGVLFVLGTLFPPLAVAARFGFGWDFFINLFLTICGYFPGHFHNFYVQNIRNNKNNARTPKWAQRYGLVDTSAIDKNKKKSQWANRYQDRNPHSTLENQQYEEGQVAGGSMDTEDGQAAPRRDPNGGLWRPDDESYYGANGDAASGTSESGGGRWHYPANFNDAAAAPDTSSRKKKKKTDKKDRWARTEDAYSLSEEAGVKKKKKKRSKAAPDADSYSQANASTDFPEDAEGGLYGGREQPVQSNGAAPAARAGEDIFAHEF
ncbi:hypothetical protein HWV62_5832 [Athelia sp. TMB]|nr:hypothetical protein HWV62_5832 [Athelia sp. TMB]